MRSNGTIGKSVCLVIAVSMIGMGTAPSIPKIYAATTTVDNTVSSNSIGTNTLSQLKIINPDGTSVDQNLVSGTYAYSATVKNSIQSITLFLKEMNESGPITVTNQNTTNTPPVNISLNPGVNLGEYTTDQIPLDIGDNTISISVSDGTNSSQYTLKVTREESGSTTGTSTTGTSTTGTSSTGTSSTGTSSTGTSSTGTSSTGTSTTGKSTTGTSSTGTSTTGTSTTGKSTTGTSSKGIPSKGSSTTRTSSTGKSSSSYSKISSHKGSINQYSSRGITVLNKTSPNMNGSNSSGASWGQSSQQGTTIAQKPSTATLSTLTVSAGTWNKTFAKDTYTYHIAVSNNVDSVTLQDTTTYSGASVMINGSASNLIQLGNQKKTIIPIVVTNGSDRKTYVLVFDKDIPQPAATASTTTTTTTTVDNNSANLASSNYNPSAAAYWSNRNNSSSTSWWSRLINSIKSFFSNL